MILKLRFDMSNPEDERQFTLHMNGPKYFSVLSDLDQELRNAYKHKNSEAAGQWRERLWKLLNEAGVSLDV